MMFIDRLFLSRLGEEHLAASMAGGVTVFMFMSLPIGLLGFVNALVAQYFGSGRRGECAIAGFQGLLLSLLLAPAAAIFIPLGTIMLSNAGHDPVQTGLEIVYMRILALGCGLSFARVAAAGFFAGIGRTGEVMKASFIALLVNVFANYALIFGHFGCPALGMAGAAYGTLIGNFIGTMFLLSKYFGRHCRAGYNTHLNLAFKKSVMSKLLRFGFPAGLEFFLSIAAFNLFIQLFHSYGKSVAAAVTITFNWDLVAFLPMIGMGVAVTSLVGRHVGEKRPDLAVKSTLSAIALAAVYGGFMIVMFLFMTDRLVGVFAGEGMKTETISLAATLLKLAAIYVLGDSLMLVLGGALRGAGDTRWVMWTSVALHWTMAVAAILLIKVFHAPPAIAWTAFIAMICLIAAAFSLRFRAGAWRKIKVV